MALPPATTLFDEITDFLAGAPSMEAILAYQPSAELTQRLHHLLDKNTEAVITSDERAELDEFLRLNDLLSMLKAKTRLRLINQS